METDFSLAHDRPIISSDVRCSFVSSQHVLHTALSVIHKSIASLFVEKNGYGLTANKVSAVPYNQ